MVFCIKCRGASDSSGRSRRLIQHTATPLTPPHFLATLPGNGWQSPEGAEFVKLQFLGTTSSDGDCPTLYLTDRDTYVVQGYQVTDPEALAELRDVLPGETFVEIPRELIKFA